MIAGVLYGGVGAYGSFQIDKTASTLEKAKAPEHKEFGFRSIKEWKDGARFTMSLFLGLGLAAIVCGAGIVALQEWARIAWLVASVLLVALVAFLVIEHPGRWRSYLELLAFALPSFVVLYGRFAKNERAI